MNLFHKSAFVAAAAALIITAGTAVRADEVAAITNVTDGTYTFTATDGNTVMDGSWVTFTGAGINQTISAWDLVDTSALAANAWLAQFGPQYGYPEFFPPLTTANSSLYSLSTFADAGPNGVDSFAFNISSSYDIFSFEGANNVNGVSSLYDQPNYNVIPGNIVPNFNGDPIGFWTYSAASAGVPDTSATFGLLFAALAALGALARCSPARSAAVRA